ncbi:cytochrome b/b6 domain-containing protein [Sulfitobacter sp. HNIBRBA2951]|uniref:cytochrome b/b6 domain-containing protein n=1 Tax=Sulfitobacter aquimarinus TaxID=3158557 RepID=UPI0032DF89B0
MALSNTPTTYGSVTRTLHWITALLVITLIPVAVIANRLPYETSAQLDLKGFMFSLHKTLGVAVFFVALLRIVWALSQPKPAPLHPDRKTETFLAETAHWLLYGSLVLAPLSGWVHHATTIGFAPIWWPFGQNLPLVPKSEALEGITYGLHWVFGKVMAATILLHVLGALKHQFVDRDATLQRMLRHTPDIAVPPAQPHIRGPLVAAVAVWGVVLAGAGAFGLYASHGTVIETAELADVASDWQVQEGTISITANQFGGDVTGSFADWTADITFDPAITNGPAGSVEVVIAVGSLTLGSMTDQALAPDFFDARTYETAVFKADLITGIDGHEAIGTLQVRDQTVPVTMPFRLSLNGDVATVQSNLTLQRLDFGVGANMPDESTLAFDVGVAISLTATR